MACFWPISGQTTFVLSITVWSMGVISTVDCKLCNEHSHQKMSVIIDIFQPKQPKSRHFLKQMQLHSIVNIFPSVSSSLYYLSRVFTVQFNTIYLVFSWEATSIDLICISPVRQSPSFWNSEIPAEPIRWHSSRPFWVRG